MRTLASYRQSQTMHSEVDSEGSWAISYGDMITLLLTFFILFFNTNKHQDVSKAVQQALLARLETSIAKSENTIIESKGNDAQTALSVDEQLIKKLNAKVMAVGSKIVVEFPNISFFKSGHTELTKEGEHELAAFSTAFVPYAGAQRVIIRAYTDEKPVRVSKDLNRPFKNNMELSVLRAVSTARALQVSGVPLSRIMPGGFGEMRLQAGGTVDRSFARKVVLVIEPIVGDTK